MKITSLDDINSGVQEWMAKKGVHKIIAFSGGSSADKMEGANPKIVEKLNESIAEYVNAVIEGSIKLLQDYRIAILTGGTHGGVPEDAAKLAKKYGLPTIGVYPERGRKRALSEEIIDCAIEVSSVFGKSMYGDESPVFAKLADASIILGGGAGTLVEVSHALKINESLLNEDGTLKDPSVHQKYIIPINGIQGAGSIIQLLPIKDHVKRATFPDKDIRTGQDIIRYLGDKISLGDYHIRNQSK